MRIVKINNDLISKFSSDPQMIQNPGRPCVLVVRLNYKGKKYDFAVPIRSNIPCSVSRRHFFALPTRSTTKPHHHHGIQYMKMFPIKKEYFVKYRTEGNPFATLIKSVIDRNASKIANECQSYLDDYAAGKRPACSTNIDFLISELYPQEGG